MTTDPRVPETTTPEDRRGARPVRLRRWLRGLSLNRKLALLALALGALAVFGDPYGGGAVKVDSAELARLVEGELDHVAPRELAGWRIEGRNDFRLLDLRDADAYAAYHLPGAEHVAVTALAGYPLYRNETIVLYSDTETHAAQAWFLLRARGYAGSRILAGGLEAWKEQVLFPVLPELPEGAAAEEVARAAELREVSRFFGGQPRGADAAAGAELALPEVEMPAAPAVPPPAQRRKKKEGC